MGDRTNTGTESVRVVVVCAGVDLLVGVGVPTEMFALVCRCGRDGRYVKLCGFCRCVYASTDRIVKVIYLQFDRRRKDCVTKV